MANPTLMDIIPNQLFQSRYICEINKVQKTLEREIESQKKELRAMVCERYSDLIHATDTIGELKLTTTITLEHIGILTATCRNLNNTHLVRDTGFENSSPLINSILAISVEVKILMESQAKIWAYIETKDYIKATNIFLLMRHIKTVLEYQLEHQKLPSLQRLVCTLWYSLSNFKQIIVDICRNNLQCANLSVEMAFSCLISLHLLEKPHLVELLNILLEQYGKSNIRSYLENDVESQTKHKIVNGLKIVLKTIVLIYSCFFNKEGDTISTKLSALYNQDSEPLIKLVCFMDSEAINNLPSTIINYRLSADSELYTLFEDTLFSLVENWTAWLKEFISETENILLQNITEIPVINNIRMEALNSMNISANWCQISSAMNLPLTPTYVWYNYFQPSLTTRVKVIINNHWKNYIDIVKMQIMSNLQRLSCESERERECDINWYVWQNLIEDTTVEINSNVIEVLNALMICMSQQDRGITPNLQNLCKHLDLEMQTLLDNLKKYLTNDNVISKDNLLLYGTEENLNHILMDKESIEQHLQDVADHCLHYIIKYIKALFNEPALQLSEQQHITTAIYMARLLSSISLVPHLHKCYMPIDDPKNTARWNAVTVILQENSTFCWKIWLNFAIKKVKYLGEVLPQKFNLEANIDYLMMKWDTIKIQEKDDNWTTIDSLLKVPAGPSLKLQEYLYQVSLILNAIVPHTLPSEIHYEFVEKVTNITLAHYHNVITRNESDINQRCALQLLMDVRYLNLLLVPKQNKKFLDLSRSIYEFLIQKIDPFDYYVLYPHIQTNEKRSVQRVQLLFGSLILHHEKLSSILGTKPIISSGTGDNSTGILAVTDFNRFPLLPVSRVQDLKQNTVDIRQTGVDKRALPLENLTKKKSDIPASMTSSLPSNIANAKYGAISLFNVVASEWFSSSK